MQTLTNRPNPRRAWLWTILSSLLMTVIFFAAFHSAHAQPSPAAAAADCTGVTAVPVDECSALVDLYGQAGGDGWLNRTHWLQFGPAAPCGWYGVVCRNGSVAELLLAGNQLSGTLPATLGRLNSLERLRLENNALGGPVAPGLCALVDTLQEGNVAFNGLYTNRPNVQRCVDRIDPDWLATQTTAVVDLLPTAFFTDGIQLEWRPISYTADSGYYEVSIATALDGPYVVHGRTADKQAAGYLVDGLAPGTSYFIQVRTHTLPHDSQPGTLVSESAKIVAVTRALAGRVLVAAYFSADNDLAPHIDYVVDRFRRGTQLNPNVQVMLLVDGRKRGDSQVLEIAGGETLATDAVESWWGRSELDTADPAVLTWFLRYAQARFPAARTVAALIGHGIALAPELEFGTPGVAASAPAETGGKLPPLPKEHDFTPSDLTDNSYMSTTDVGRALLAATDDGAKPFDVVFFDQCFQGSLDMLYEVRQSAKVIVASPNYAWLAAAYDKYIARITPTAAPAEIAQAIIAGYQSSLNPQHPNSIFWVKSGDITAIAAAVSSLGDALRAALLAGQANKIAQAVVESKYVDTTQCSKQNLQLGPPDELIGLETFGAGLQTSFGPGDPYGVHVAAGQVLALMQQVERFTRAGNPYIAPDEFWDYRDTITVLAPLPRNSPAVVAWRASVYRNDVPLAARWTVDPTQPVTVTASLASVQDGRWDEFLAAWYTGLTPTVGQWCNYIPPQQVTVDDLQTLTSTAVVSGTDAILVNWTEADDAALADYRVFLDRPNQVNWVLEQVVPPGQTATLLTELPPGSYRVAVGARNEDNAYVARTLEVTVVLPTSAQPSLFLPLVSR